LSEKIFLKVGGKVDHSDISEMERVNVRQKVVTVILITPSFPFLSVKYVFINKDVNTNLSVFFITMRDRKRVTGRQITREQPKYVVMLRMMKFV
jgi:predicted nucleotidyltransferase